MGRYDAEHPTPPAGIEREQFDRVILAIINVLDAT
jgi:hypothetical protein